MIISKLLFALYGSKRRAVRDIILKTVKRIEGGEFNSLTLRKIFSHYHQVDIGLYSHGGCFVPKALDVKTKIGRYCSIAHGVRVFNRNHPVDFKGMHAFFFNPRLGYCDEDRIEYTPLTIGNDVWIGYGALITPEVKEIGHGAVIGAGSVLNKNIPPYGIAVGNPARVVRYRFEKKIIEDLLNSRWWDLEIGEIAKNIAEYQNNYEKLKEIKQN